MNIELLSLYNAVVSDDGIEVQKILRDNSLSSHKMSVRMITGMLVLAIESKHINASRAIIAHNTYSGEKISDNHFNAIMLKAFEFNLLPQLQITYH